MAELANIGPPGIPSTKDLSAGWSDRHTAKEGQVNGRGAYGGEHGSPWLQMYLPWIGLLASLPFGRLL
jgi:hypothetical protein